MRDPRRLHIDKVALAASLRDMLVVDATAFPKV